MRPEETLESFDGPSLQDGKRTLFVIVVRGMNPPAKFVCAFSTLLASRFHHD